MLKLNQYIYSSTLTDVENVVQKQIKEGNVAGLIALQRQISKAVGTGNKIFRTTTTGFHQTIYTFNLEGHRSGFVPRAVIPIDDIGNVEPSNYAKGEKELRCKLASLYRLVDHFGWSQAIFNHITVQKEDDDLLSRFKSLFNPLVLI